MASTVNLEPTAVIGDPLGRWSTERLAAPNLWKLRYVKEVFFVFRL